MEDWVFYFHTFYLIFVAELFTSKLFYSSLFMTAVIFFIYYDMHIDEDLTKRNNIS